MVKISIKIEGEDVKGGMSHREVEELVEFLNNLTFSDIVHIGDGNDIIQGKITVERDFRKD